VVTAVTTVARTVLRPDQWTAAIAILTTGFAIGQCVGPLLAGVLADSADGVRSGLLVSAVILAAGVLISLAQPAHTPEEHPTPRTEPEPSAAKADHDEEVPR
jgi:MFS family permease